ncbi:hypothetical protein BDV93DRAFT_593985 [Ceratobasidium sp. AG-I]|nr:hypothetical protein BDV93DRAFT_593985 [Ceratobasidium sp. AG-I]
MSILPEHDLITMLTYGNFTCKKHHEIIVRSSIIQLRIELESSGFQLSDKSYEGGSENMAAPLLEEFKRYRDGWLYLKLGKSRRLKPNTRLSEFRQGYYVTALSNSPSLADLTDLETGSKKLLNLHDLHFSRILIDPSEGLLVLVSVDEESADISNVHLCSFHTGEPHSEAQRPDWKIQLPFHMNRADSRIVLQTMDQLLALMYTSTGDTSSEILIWNWKLGTLVHRIQSSASSSTLAFLTPDSLLVSCAYSLNAPVVSISIFEVVRVPLNPTLDDRELCVASSYTPLVACVELKFPAFPEGATIQLSMSAEPAPTATSFASSKFVPSPTAGVLQLCLSLFSGEEQGRRQSKYHILLGKDCLLKYLTRSHNTTESANRPMKIPWEEWGERSTRWFSRAATPDSCPWRVYGTRSIQGMPAGESPDDRAFEYLSVLDFHPPTVRRFSSLSQDRHLSMWGAENTRRHMDFHSSERDLWYVLNALQSKQSPSQENLVFVDTIGEDVPAVTLLNGRRIFSRLPYRVVTRIRPVLRRPGWLIDNDHIVGMPGVSNPIRHAFTDVYTPGADN